LCILKIRGGNEHIGSLYIADLAGSERVTHSHVQGERLDETKHINRSLSCLADVFSALRNQQAHIPYRNSRLTFLLRPALSKAGKAMLIVHVRYVFHLYRKAVFSRIFLFLNVIIQ
jgi:kinesin family protein C1